ncbi:unnamed protein product [Mucor hiemalis]
MNISLPDFSQTNNRRRELLDLEQRLQMQEQIHVQYILDTKEPQQVYQSAMVKQGFSTVPSPIVIMKPYKEKPKKSKRESLLNKVYGFRNSTSPPPPPIIPNQQIIRPSSIRSPSFLPMQEKRLAASPPAYGDYRNSTPVVMDTKQ